jgi:outer membrane lipoprotein-sorting protein
MKSRLINLMILAVFTFSILTLSQNTSTAQEMSADEVVAKYYDAFYSQASDMKAKVTMDLISKSGKTRNRKMVMLRKDFGDKGDQKYFIYFYEPGDVRRTSFLVWKYPDTDDERWMYIPAVDLVKKIAAKDKRSSFIGSDFTYEDISGRDVQSDTHRLLRTEKMNDRDCYVVESLPKEKVEYTKRISWIDKKTFLPIKEEYYDVQKELYRVFQGEEIKDVPSGEGEKSKVFPTILKRTMDNVKKKHKTVVYFSEVQYDAGIEENIYTERFLRKPPTKWIK